MATFLNPMKLMLYLSIMVATAVLLMLHRTDPRRTRRHQAHRVTPRRGHARGNHGGVQRDLLRRGLQSYGSP